MATADLGGVKAVLVVAWDPDVDDRNVLAVAHRRRFAHRAVAGPEHRALISFIYESDIQVVVNVCHRPRARSGSRA